jgi:hypothetical protein
MKEFEQVEKLPNVVLTRQQQLRTVRMWEQGPKGRTVAFNVARRNAEGDAFSYLWPILVDTRKIGRCV